MPRWTKEEYAAFMNRKGRPLVEVFAEENKQAPKTNMRPSMSIDESKLNKTEREYLQRMRLQLSEGHYLWIGIQNITLKIGDNCRYTPDFVGVTDNGLMCLIEVKGGFIRDDALVKLKVAARQYPMFDFILAQKKGGQWTEKLIGP